MNIPNLRKKLLTRRAVFVTLLALVLCALAALIAFCLPRAVEPTIPDAPITRALTLTPTSTLTATPTIPPTITWTPTNTSTITPTASPTPTNFYTLTPTETATSIPPTPTPINTIVPGRNGTMPTTGADPTQLFFMRALQPLGEIQFPFTLAEFLGYLAGGILTYPASKFIFEKLDEWFPDLFGLPKLSRAQKRFAAYPIAALIAVGATVLLHYLGYASLSMDALYKAFGTAFLTAQALHGYFDLTGADPAQESKNALVNLFAAVKGFQFAHVDAKVSESGEMRERYLELLNAASEAEKLLNAGAKKQ